MRLKKEQLDAIYDDYEKTLNAEETALKFNTTPKHVKRIATNRGVFHTTEVIITPFLGKKYPKGTPVFPALIPIGKIKENKKE